MSAVAPVCHIPPKTPNNQPAPVNLPAIPPAGNTIASLQATVNIMRQVIMLLAGQQGSPGQNGTSATPPKPARWTEQSRQTETVRIFDPNDKSVFVDVERINKLIMHDGVTGESWTWNRQQKP